MKYLRIICLGEFDYVGTLKYEIYEDKIYEDKITNKDLIATILTSEKNIKVVANEYLKYKKEYEVIIEYEK